MFGVASEISEKNYGHGSSASYDSHFEGIAIDIHRLDVSVCIAVAYSGQLRLEAISCFSFSHSSVSSLLP